MMNVSATGVLVVGVFVIPILYIIFQWLQEKISGAPEAAQTEKKSISEKA